MGLWSGREEQARLSPQQHVEQSARGSRHASKEAVPTVLGGGTRRGIFLKSPQQQEEGNWETAQWLSSSELKRHISAAKDSPTAMASARGALGSAVLCLLQRPGLEVASTVPTAAVFTDESAVHRSPLYKCEVCLSESGSL